jgi:adenylate kinase family enzyme
MEIGRRVVVYGVACSGKSTLANRIAQSINVPHIELDALFWTTQWVGKPLEEFRSEVLTILDANPDGWVCDGNYSRVRDLILPLASTVVWLRPPFRIAFWRLLKRTITRCWNHELLWGNNRESWRLAFLHRDSLFLYLIRNWHRFHREVERALENTPHKALIIELYSAKEVNSFLASFCETQ